MMPTVRTPHQSQQQHAIEASPKTDVPSPRVFTMATRRRARGSVKGSFALYAEVSHEAAEKADVLAKRLSVSKAEFVEAALIHAASELDADGLPAWWTRPLPHREELDLRAS